MAHKQIRVLVVDDSMIFREVITRGISTDPNIDASLSAIDPYDARDKILRFSPDVMICDVEMPRMNGIEFIRRLLPQYPLAVIVVSTVNHAVFDALNAGAVDFVSKPDLSTVDGIEQFIRELITKVKVAAYAQVSRLSEQDHRPMSHHHGYVNKMVVLGASTGGIEAITQLIRQLPENFPGIAIVQHIPPVYSSMFAKRLNQLSGLQVKEAETGDVIAPGRVLIAPGSMHMRLRRVDGHIQAECSPGDRVNGHCPSIDVLFESAAKVCGSSAVGVILTGMGYDGAKGLLAMRRKGSSTFGQDENSSVIYGMPKAAFELGAVQKQASLSELPRLLSHALQS